MMDVRKSATHAEGDKTKLERVSTWLVLRDKTGYSSRLDFLEAHSCLSTRKSHVEQERTYWDLRGIDAWGKLVYGYV